MDRKLLILLCYVIAFSLATDEHRPKKSSSPVATASKSTKPEDARGKRNLEYHISHHYTPLGLNYRAERRISTGPTNFRYPAFFPPGPPKHYVHFRRGRPGPHSLPPPYAVQMEPLVHYSQRDPLYDKLPFIPDTQNDLVKSDDLLTDNNHISENIYNGGGSLYGAPPQVHQQYGAPQPVQQHQPHTVYLKEPEPIIEIIIKESNETLPPPPQPIIPVTKPKKEPVQVFYVKYKKNPNGSGKDSIIYDAPIPAISPPVKDEHEDEPVQHRAPVETVTYAPPPTTTLRAIIRPESEQYHAPDGIHVTFDQDKPLPSEDGHPHEESAPPPALAFPGQGPPPQFNRPPPPNNQHHAPQHNFPSGPPPHNPNFSPSQPFSQQPSFNHQRQFHSQPQAFQGGSFFQPRGLPSHARFNGPPPPNPQAHFSQQQSLPIRPAQNFNSQPPFQPQHGPPAQFNQPLQSQHRPTFTNPPGPRSNFGPVPPQFNPRPSTHFPIAQPPQQHGSFNQPPQPPQNHFQSHPPSFQQSHFQGQNSQQFNQQHGHREQQFNNYESFPPNHTPFQQPNQGQFQNQQFQHHNQPQPSQAPQQQNFQQQNFQQQQQHQQQQNFNHNQQGQNFRHQDLLPPGGELIHSVPKFEQHVSVQVPVGQLHQAHLVTPPPTPALSKEEYSRQIQDQFQPIQSPRPPQQQQPQQQYNQQQQINHQQQISQQQQQLNQQQQQITQQQQQIKQQQLINQHQQQQNARQQQLTQQQVQNYNQQQVQIEQSHDQASNFFSSNLPTALKQDAQKNYFSQPQQKAPEDIFKTTTSLQTSPRTNSIFQQTFPSSTHKNVIYRTTSKPSYLEFTKPTTTTTTPRPQAPLPTTTESPEKKAANAKKIKETVAQLPDEVPEDLRQQLLSSGILSNADISILDYDKVGDIPIESLPPDQLANFYGAGGAQQIAAAGSAPIPSVVKPNGQSVDLVNTEEEVEDQEGEGSEIDEVRIPYTANLESSPSSPSNGQAVEMKVVRFDPQTEQGQDVQDSYVREDATRVDPVVLNDQTYNRYLPLKVSGAQFPIPDVPELKGRNVTSVVVLAPVDYNFVSSARPSREATPQTDSNLKGVRFYAGQALKELVRKPSTENFKKWLESENKTSTDKQSVVLLVTGSTNDTDKEIFMYDVTTQTVSKLSGELSSAFVDAAEANVSDEDIESLASPPKKYTKQQDAKSQKDNKQTVEEDDKEAVAASNRVETRVRFPEEPQVEDVADLDGAASDLVESKIPIIDPMEPDLAAEGSEALESFVDISAKPLGDLTVSESGERNANDKILIESGYSRTG